MPPDTLLRSVVAACGSFVLCGVMCTLSLFAGIGIVPAGILIGIICGAWLWYWLRKSGSQMPDPRLLAVAAAVTVACCIIVKAHGAYDAWLHWNSLAKYFSDPSFFKQLGRPDSLWHADYPPGLPAPIGFVWRVLHTDAEAVPGIFSFLFYCSIPLLLCEAAMRNGRIPWLWIAVLALFTANFECVSQGLNQYADIPLALLLLLAIMCWKRGAAQDATRWNIACGLMLGGCLLLKNEGSLLVLAFLLSRRGAQVWTRIAQLLPGLLIAGATVVYYKRFIPEPNDVVSGMALERLRQFYDPSRYRIIGYYLLRFGIGRFPMFVLFFACVIWRRRMFRWRMTEDGRCLLFCALGFLTVYLGTGIGLEWLVPTSLNRLMMQLLPAGVYVALNALQQRDQVIKPPAFGS